MSGNASGSASSDAEPTDTVPIASDISSHLNEFKSIADRLSVENARTIALARECCTLHRLIWHRILVAWDRGIEHDYSANRIAAEPEQY